MILYYKTHEKGRNNLNLRDIGNRLSHEIPLMKKKRIMLWYKKGNGNEAESHMGRAV